VLNRNFFALYCPQADDVEENDSTHV
jgi:hypothetical protein